MTTADSKSKRSVWTLTSALIGAALAGPAMAQDAQPADAAGEIVVTGYKLQNQQAVAAKREEQRIAEFLTSDDIGQQPDYNISDAFRRVPGVTTIFDEDEGRYVALRGLEPNFTLGSLDGSTLATGERFNRQLNLEAVPTTAVRRLEIFKSRTPDTEGNAIGGTINLVTRSAFDHRGLYLVGSGFIGEGDSQAVPGEGFNRESDDGLNYRFDGTVSARFGDRDQFGVLATGAFSRKRRDQERYSPGAYTLFNGVPVSASHLWQGYPNTVDRYGGTVKLEWRPTDALEAHVSGTYYIQADNELRLSHQLTRGTVDLTRTGGSTARVSTAGGFSRYNDFAIDKPLLAFQAGFTWSPDGPHEISGRAAYSEAAFNEPSNQLQFNLPTSAANAYNYVLFDKVPTVRLDSTATFLNPALYNFGSYFTYEDDSDDYITEAQLDWRFNAGRGDEGWGFGAGVKTRENERDYDRTQVNYALGAGQTLNLSQVILAAPYRPLYAEQNALFLDFRRFQALRAANANLLTVNTATTATDSRRNDYIVTEEVNAAYGLVRHAGARHVVTAGVRFEQTDTEVNGFRQAGTTLTALNRTGSYDNWLPSIGLTYDLTDQWRARLAYFQAIGRPNPSQLGNNEVLNTTALTLSRGNPDLLPRDSHNLDAALEYYFGRNQGIFSIGVFHKEISDNIFNVSLGTAVIDGATYTVTQPRNVGDAQITGLELNLVRNSFDFLPDFLPDFLENFGASANVTIIKADATLSNGRSFDQLNQMPNEQANVALFYEQGPFKARATYAYVGERLTSISESNFLNNRFDAPYNQVDVQSRWTIGRLSFISEVRNLTDENRINYNGFGGLDFNFFGRQYWLGVTVKN